MIFNYKSPESKSWRFSYHIIGTETGDTGRVRQPTHKIVARETMD